MTKHLLTASCYDKRGTLISRAVNSYTRTHPVQATFAKQVGMPMCTYLHAEIAALLKCGRRVPYSITIERYKKDGSPGNAKPCPICEAAIKAWGVRRVTFTLG